MAERIEKYRSDSVKLQDASIQKLKSELISLNKWVVKHQYEALADGDKSKLIAVLQFYYKLSVDRSDEHNQLKNAVHSLLDDFLKLPEGKLVSAKGKQGVLRWLQSLDEVLDPTGLIASKSMVSARRFGVADILGDGTIKLMDLTTNSLVEEQLKILDAELVVNLSVKFEELGYLEIVISEGIILNAYDIDGNVLYQSRESIK